MDRLQKERAESVVKAHVRWFKDLRNAIETGRSDKVPAVVAADTECEFGKWVHSELAGFASRDLLAQITRIHADFHQAAAAILTMALDGRRAEARARLGAGSELADLSKRLVQKVQELR